AGRHLCVLQEVENRPEPYRTIANASHCEIVELANHWTVSWTLLSILIPKNRVRRAQLELIIDQTAVAAMAAVAFELPMDTRFEEGVGTDRSELYGFVAWIRWRRIPVCRPGVLASGNGIAQKLGAGVENPESGGRLEVYHSRFISIRWEAIDLRVGRSAIAYIFPVRVE